MSILNIGSILMYLLHLYAAKDSQNECKPELKSFTMQNDTENQGIMIERDGYTRHVLVKTVIFNCCPFIYIKHCVNWRDFTRCQTSFTEHCICYKLGPLSESYPKLIWEQQIAVISFAIVYKLKRKTA